MAGPDGTITYCNQYWRGILGVALRQGQWDGWERVLHPDDLSRALQVWHNAAATGTRFASEYRFRHGSGEYRWYLSNGVPVKDANGQVVQWLGTAVEIHDQKAAQAAHEDAEGRLRLAIEAARLGTWDNYLDRGYLRLSDRNKAMYGLPPETELTYEDFLALVHPEDRTLLQEKADQAMAPNGDHEFEVEFRVIRHDGQIRWIAARGMCIFAESSKGRRPIRFTGTQQDITEHKLAYEALRASEARLRTILNAEPECVKLVSAEGRVLDINPAGLAMMEAGSIEELETRPMVEGIEEEYREPFRDLTRRVFEGKSGILDFKAKGFKGTPRWLQTHAVPLRKATGEVEACLSITRDVTDQKMAEEERQIAESALRASEERFEKAFRSSPLPITITTLEDARFLDVNEAFLQMSGYDRDAVVGHTSTELNIWADPSDRERMIEQLASSGKATGIQARFRTSAGEVRRSELAAETIQLGVTPCILIISRDITDNLRLEGQLRQAQKMEAVGRLAGGVAHDFNNILGVIIGYIEISREQLSPAHPLLKNLAEIKKAAERAASLTRQLLAFSRQQVVRMRALDLNAVVSNLNEMLTRMVGEDISIRLQLGGSLGAIRADGGQLEQVLMNLVVNARDAMPRGGRIVIQTENVEVDESHSEQYPSVPPGLYVMLSVTDDGSGMDAETMTHMFEPFFTTKGLGQGTGLGLSTVYGIVQQANGHIWARSEPGKGATFYICFPRIAQPSALAPLSREVAPGGGCETILLVEDDEPLRRLTVDLLTRGGYQIVEARDAQAAIRLAQDYSDKIDLLLTDMILPDMSGSALAGHVLTLRPDIKVLYTSGYTRDPIERHGGIGEGIELLDKPFTKNSLLRKVRVTLDGFERHPSI